MRKRLIVQVVAAVSLMVPLLAGLPSAFAQTQSPGFSTKSVSLRPGGPGSDPVAVTNAITGQCLDDSATYGLRAIGCNNLRYQRFFITTLDGGRTWVLQNAKTGSCVDDSAAYGLRGYYCNNLDYQEFFVTTHNNGYSWVLQNAHTGSCVDNRGPRGVRGWYCTDTGPQHWIIDV